MNPRVVGGGVRLVRDDDGIIAQETDGEGDVFGDALALACSVVIGNGIGVNVLAENVETFEAVFGDDGAKGGNAELRILEIQRDVDRDVGNGGVQQRKFKVLGAGGAQIGEHP